MEILNALRDFLQWQKPCQVLGEGNVPREGTAPLAHLRRKVKKRKKPQLLWLSLYELLVYPQRSVTDYCLLVLLFVMDFICH